MSEFNLRDDDDDLESHTSSDGGLDVNVLDMSDEEFEKQERAFEEALSGTSVPDSVDTDASNRDSSDNSGSASGSKDSEDQEDDNGPEEDEESEGDESQDPDESEEDESDEAGDGEDDPSDDPDDSEETAEEEGNTSKAEEGKKGKDGSKDKAEDKDDTGTLAELFEPFKAAGEMMSVSSVAEAKKLMQMGVQFNKRMQTINPHLKLIKSLENNGLLDQNKINKLIDLSKGNKQAIASFLKEQELDPLSIDTEEDSGYKPTQHGVSDEEIAIDNVIAELSDSPTFSRTLDTVGVKWDDASRNVISAEPNLMRILDTQMGNGIFDKINSEVTKQRALGNLNGINDFEAYRQVGHLLDQQGLLRLDQPKAEPLKQKIVRPKSNDTDGQTRKNKKRAGGSVKASSSKKATKDLADINPLNMSDEEFEKRYGDML